LHPHEGAQRTQRAPGRKTGSILAPPFEEPRRERSSDGVEPGHTPRSRVRSKGAHAVEFSKTAAPLRGRSSSSNGAPESPNWIPGRTDEYSAQNGPQRFFALATGEHDSAPLSIRPGRSPCVLAGDRRNR
jgi:hypothetical protein